MKTTMKVISLTVASIMALSLAACGGSGSGTASSGDTLKVGALYNLTGGQASLDKPSYNGFKMAADEINAAGGIDGKMIEVVSYDGKTDQTTCANNAKKMIDVDNVLIVAGFSDSNYALAAGQICQQKSVPFITSGATLQTIPDQVGDYAFLAPFGDDIQAYACADFMLDDMNAKTCYLLTDMSMEFTKTLAECFEERFLGGGGEIVLKDTYMNKDPDFSAQIDRFLAEAPDVDFLFISGVPDDAGVVVKQFRDKGVTLPIISGDGYDTPLLMEVAGDQAYDVYVGTHTSLANPDEKVVNFVKGYNELYGNAPENAFAALGYDCMYLIADAMKRATDPTDPTAIRDALAETSGLVGVTGTVTYLNGSHVPTKSVTINKAENGEFVFQKEITPE